MIHIRDDDVVVDKLDRFIKVQEIIKTCDYLNHIVTILCYHLNKESIDYIKSEQDRLKIELHGWEHVGYEQMTETEVVDNLNMCKKFLKETFDVVPTRWYTPFGANTATLRAAASATNLKLVDTSGSYKLNGRYGVLQNIRDGRKLSFYDDKEILIHYWKRIDIERLSWLANYINTGKLP